MAPEQRKLWLRITKELEEVDAKAKELRATLSVLSRLNDAKRRPYREIGLSKLIRDGLKSGEWTGMTGAQIALALGANTGSVQAILSRVKSDLRIKEAGNV